MDQHPLDVLLANVHTQHDIYEATIAKAAIPGHEFDIDGPQGQWVTIGVGTKENLPQIGRIENGRVVAVRSGTVMPGRSLLERYAQHHDLGSAKEAEERLARLRVLAAGTYIVQGETADRRPRVVAFSLGGHEKVAPKTEQSMRALETAGYKPAESVFGENAHITGQLSPSEVLLRYDAAPDAPDREHRAGMGIDTTDRQINPDSRFADWNAAVAYWEQKVATADGSHQDLPPAVGHTALER